MTREITYKYYHFGLGGFRPHLLLTGCIYWICEDKYQGLVWSWQSATVHGASIDVGAKYYIHNIHMANEHYNLSR